MAIDKAITDLPVATEIGDEDYLVLQQNNVAKSVRGAIVKKYAGDVFNDAKDALLALLSKVAYIDENGQTYLDNLEAALMKKVVLSITAVFNQGTAVIYTHDNLDDLRQYLTVTANYDDGTSSVVTTYTLNGELTAGTSTITATYSGKTTTFAVTVTQGVPSGYTVYDYIQRYADSGTIGVAQAGQIRLKTYENLNALSCEFAYCALSGHYSGMCIWGRRDGAGNTKSYAFYAGDGSLGYHLHGNDSDPRFNAADDAVHTVKYTNSASSPSTLAVDNGTPQEIVWENNNTLNLDPTLLTNAFDNTSNSNLAFLTQIGYIKFFDLSGGIVGHYIPAVRNSDNVIGMYDIVEQAFYTAPTKANATIGASAQKYKVGNW